MLTKPRTYYKPFKYPWAFEAYHLQNKMHWLPDEVPLHDDVHDWNNTLTLPEKNLLTQIFRFFVQGDLDVAGGYLDKYIPRFKPPEIRMMLSSFAAMEAVHIHAYSLLIDTVGMPETEYQAFTEYEEMAEKHDYMSSNSSLPEWAKYPDSDAKNVWTAQDLAVFSAFGEGLQLFSSFAILMNFPRHGKMKGMGQIVTWSIRDETHHVENMIKLFKAFIDENPHIWNDEFKGTIYQICRDMVDLEDNFIDLAFSEGGIEGLTSSEVKQYIRFIADRRLLQLGLKANYGVKDNPLPWLDYMLNAVEHTNFFENRATEYTKAATTGDWGDVF